MNEDPTLQLQDLEFGWRNGPRWRIPHLRLERGESAFLEGPSGSGKSTLLALLAGLILPQRGDLSILGQSLAQLSRRRRDRFRAEHLGIIFQQFNLIPYLNPVQNVLLGLAFAKKRRRALEHSPRAIAETLLAQLDLPESLWHSPTPKLSVGQQQRVAAARALIGAPPLILADEPTSALDSDNRDRFLDLLLTQAHQHGSSVLFVSHDPALSAPFARKLTMTDWQGRQP
jgi:putative ABC transport system ATP-binding protein